METILQSFSNVISDHTFSEFLWFLGLFLTTFLFLFLLKKLLYPRPTTIPLDEQKKHKVYLGAIARATNILFIFLFSFWLGTQFLHLSPKVVQTIEIIFLTVFWIQLALWVRKTIRLYLEIFREKNLKNDAGSVTTLYAGGFFVQLLAYGLIFLLILDNFNIEITPLLAGLGIGGIAIGLAAQSVLADLFASLAIVLDKPFVIGDFIIVDEFKGKIENIGVKTTKIRSIEGEQIVIPNGNLMNSRIRNFQRLERRRCIFSLGVLYQTPAEKLENIPTILQEIIKREEKTTFDRCHFKGFGDSALLFEAVYFVENAEYKYFLDIQQKVNLNIVKRFREEGIDIAYPTRTLFMEKVD